MVDPSTSSEVVVVAVRRNTCNVEEDLEIEVVVKVLMSVVLKEVDVVA